jgi:hypothetical protein
MLVPQADFLELKRHKLIFLNFGAAGKIMFIISIPYLQILELISAPQANFLQVNEQKKDCKNEIGDLVAPKSRGPLAVAQIAIP